MAYRDGLKELYNGNAHDPAQETIMIFDDEGQLHAPLLGALLAHEIHPEKRVVARVHARSGHQITQHAAPRALARGGAVALQPAAVSNQRVAQEDSFREGGVVQRRQQAVGGGGIESASAGSHNMCQIRERTLGEIFGP